MTKEEIIKQYEAAVEGGELIAPFMGEDEKELYEMLKAGLSALRPVSREQVERMQGEWIDLRECYNDIPKRQCSHCGKVLIGLETPFCEACGAPMTDEAVQMVMERMEKLHEDNGCS